MWCKVLVGYEDFNAIQPSVYTSCNDFTESLGTKYEQMLEKLFAEMKSRLRLYYYEACAWEAVMQVCDGARQIKAIAAILRLSSPA